MAISDALLSFVPLNSALSLVAGAGINIPSPNIIDLLGPGVGVAPSLSIIGNVTNYGASDGMGVGKSMELLVTIGTTLTTSNSATLNAALQAAADTGSAGGYQPGTWNTIVETGPIAVANLTAGTVIFRCPWLPPFPANLRPRFLRLLFQVPTGTDFTAGTIGSALAVMIRADQFNRYAANNYKVL